MSRLAQQERQALCDTFARVGHDAPTLCEGWLTRDLAAHLVVRERRPDAALGMFVRPLAGHTEAVMARLADRDWEQLVDLVRSGPGRLSPLGIPRVDEAVNLGEFFIHHEDVLRGVDPAARRTLSEPLERALWKGLSRMGGMTLRSSPVGVLATSPGYGTTTLRKLRDARGSVTLCGGPGEILLAISGRGPHDVEIDGDPEAVAAFAAYSPGL